MNLEGILHQLVEEKKFRKLRGILEEMNEVDIAEFIQDMELDKVVLVFRLLPKELGAEVFACLEIEMQEYIINSMPIHPNIWFLAPFLIKKRQNSTVFTRKKCCFLMHNPMRAIRHLHSWKNRGFYVR